jgi:hypothetical protein
MQLSIVFIASLAGFVYALPNKLEERQGGINIPGIGSLGAGSANG